MAKAKFSPAYSRLRRALVTARTTAQLKQADVAARLGKPQSYVSKVELGERRLDVIEYAEYAAALEVDPVRLLRRVLAKR
jgi:transcriptional regulator with XRE-family HTH domain